jgi:large subunit ribosomal protein L16
MFQPKRTKFRKFMKGRCGGKRSNLQSLAFGSFGLKALESGRLSAHVLEAVRRTLTRTCKRRGKVWIRVFPDINVSSKPAEVRMGKGKGSPDYWMCRVQRGHILFEMEGVPYELAVHASRLASRKCPFPTQFVAL